MTINDYINILKSHQYDNFFDYLIENKFINNEIDLTLKEIIYQCLIIDFDKRICIDKLLEYKLFNEKDFLYDDDNFDIIIPPLTNENKEILSKKLLLNIELSPLETYICLKERYKKNFLEELYKKNILRMKPKIFNIPDYIEEEYDKNNKINLKEININKNTNENSEYKINMNK